MNSLAIIATACRLALSALRGSLLRSGLTIFGVLVGVAAVTVVIALGEGASAAVSGAIETLGTNWLEVVPAPVEASGVRGATNTSILTEDDVAAIAREAPSVIGVAPSMETSAQVVVGDANSATRVQGTMTAYFRIRDWKLALGEIWSERSENARERVCILGQTVRADLFDAANPVGQTVRIGRHPFRVIGVLAAKGQGAFGIDLDDVVIVPIGTMRTKLLPTRPGQVQRIFIGARDSDSVARARFQVTSVLRQRHGLAEGAPDDFQVRSLDEVRRTQEEIVGIVRLLLVCVAGVSLLVGGIGVMNIMLVSVAQRRREVGIRMAVGAREGDIVAQFLTEAVVLCVLGGASGIIVAAGAVAGLRRALDLPMQTSPSAAGLALATSVAVGILFGLLPARQAARLDPIEAIRMD